MEGLQIFDSGVQGSTTLVVGVIHGNEPIGYRFRDLIEMNFQKKNFIGKIFFLLANPRAAKENVRFIDQDLNRSFGEFSCVNYEVTRANEIKEFFNVCGKIDYVFDIHSTPTTSEPMMICTGDIDSIGLTKHFPIPYTIVGLTDMIEGVSLTKYLKDVFRTKNIAFECGQHNDIHTKKIGDLIFDSILQIHNTGTADAIYSQKKIHIVDCIRTSSKDFEFSRDFQGFEIIAPNEVFAIDSGKHISREKESVMVIPRPDAIFELNRKKEVILGYIGEVG